jgi:thiol-disulfide isomerase/thioredoxin
MAAVPAAAQSNADWQPPEFSVALADGTVFDYPADLDLPTIVLFWASWCPYCKALMPHLQSILDEFPGRVQVLALTIRDDEPPAPVLAEYGYDFRLVPAADPVAEAWGVKGTPGLFLADTSGRIVFDRMRIPRSPEADSDESVGKMKHYQKAARSAPRWAAHLRVALDEQLQ